MVSQKEKRQMKEFVEGKLEDTSKYNILQADENHILVIQKPELFENPAELYIALHNKAMTLPNYKKLNAEQLNNGRYFSNIFYKEDELFLVRLGASGHFRGDKSFKNYTNDEINNMVHLRGLEKLALDNQSINELAYYQPDTERLEESIRRYNMLDVKLDYSHIPTYDRRHDFVQNKIATDYKLAQEITPKIKAPDTPLFPEDLIKFKQAHNYKKIVTITLA